MTILAHPQTQAHSPAQHHNTARRGKDRHDDSDNERLKERRTNKSNEYYLLWYIFLIHGKITQSKIRNLPSAGCSGKNYKINIKITKK